MIRNLNPSFVLDLTAPPRQNSNIISIVDARELKRENITDPAEVDADSLDEITRFALNEIRIAEHVLSGTCPEALPAPA